MGETGEKENKWDGVEGLGRMWQHSVSLWDSKYYKFHVQMYYVSVERSRLKLIVYFSQIAEK